MAKESNIKSKFLQYKECRLSVSACDIVITTQTTNKSIRGKRNDTCEIRLFSIHTESKTQCRRLHVKQAANTSMKLYQR